MSFTGTTARTEPTALKTSALEQVERLSSTFRASPSSAAQGRRLLPIVYAFPCRWDMIPGRHRYLMEAISEHIPVYFLNMPSFTGRFDVRRPHFERITPNLTVVHDAFGARFSWLGGFAEKLASFVDSLWLHALLRKEGVTEYVFWLSAPLFLMTYGMRLERLVFDSIDPCFNVAQQAHFDKMEFALARQAKVVFCSAESLLDRLAPLNSNAHLLPNACSPKEYHPELLQSVSRPKALAGCTSPIIGYLGTFDWRVDLETLIEAARQLPQFTFALAGRINPDQAAKISELKALPNVIMPGAISLEEGVAYTAAFDVGLIPFRPGEMGDAINPVKMHMYLLAGKPVVTTDLRECRRYAPHVMATRTVDEFVSAIREAVASDSPERAQQRTEFALQNSWTARAAQAMKLLETSGVIWSSANSKNRSSRPTAC